MRVGRANASVILGALLLGACTSDGPDLADDADPQEQVADTGLAAPDDLSVETEESDTALAWPVVEGRSSTGYCSTARSRACRSSRRGATPTSSCAWR